MWKLYDKCSHCYMSSSCGLNPAQDDAHLDCSHTSATSLLLPGQGEAGEGHPTQDPLPAGLWRSGLSLWRTRVLASKPAGHPGPLLLLVRHFDTNLDRIALMHWAKTIRRSLLTKTSCLCQGDRWHYRHDATVHSSNSEVQHHRAISKVSSVQYYSWFCVMHVL